MILQLDHLSKSYHRKPALQGFSYNFEPGIIGILGPNGAGKSTLMNLIIDNIKPDEGEILFNNLNTVTLGAYFRKNVGFVPQQQKMYPQFSVLRFMYYMAALKGLKRDIVGTRTEEVLNLVNLYGERHKKVGELSGGMRQRLLLAQAVLDDPEILLLDEPTAGLDPEERVRIRNLIASFSRSRIVLYSTHVISDIETIADQVIFLKKGRIVASGTIPELIASLRGKVYRAVVSEDQFEELDYSKVIVSEIRKIEDGNLNIRFISQERPMFKNLSEEYAGLQEIYLELYQEGGRSDR